MSFFQFLGFGRKSPSQQMPIVLRVEMDREVDGRFIAEIHEIPGALAYGATEDEAIQKAVAIAFRVLADRVELGQLTPPEKVQFSVNLCLQH